MLLNDIDVPQPPRSPQYTFLPFGGWVFVVPNSGGKEDQRAPKYARNVSNYMCDGNNVV